MANAVAPASFKVKTRASVAINRRNSGKAATLTVTTKAKMCKRTACRIVVRSIGSKYATSGRNVKTVNISKRSQSVVANIAVNNGAKLNLSVMLQTKKGRKWVYVASGVTTR
jgi:ABC-type antimicrobial peptide transport system ATPase subunit